MGWGAEAGFIQFEGAWDSLRGEAEREEAPNMRCCDDAGDGMDGCAAVGTDAGT